MFVRKLFRSITVIFLFMFFGCGAMILNFIVFPYISMFVKSDNKRQQYSLVVHNTWKFFCKMMEQCKIIKINFTNFENLKNLKSKIIVANHPSFIDIVILLGYLPNTLCVAKKELRKNFFMGNIVKSLFLINDENKESLIKETTQILNEGFNIVIFPTGTRTEENTELKLHKGAAFMALHTLAEIIPIHIHCDTKFLAKNQLFCSAGVKEVVYNLKVNDPIRPNDFLIENLTDIQTRNRLNNKIKERISD